MRVWIPVVISAFLFGCNSTPSYNKSSLDKFVVKQDKDKWNVIMLVEPLANKLPSEPYEGCVNLEFVVGSNGKPQDIVVKKSFPDNQMIANTITSFSKSKFVAGKSNPKSAPMVSNLIFTFDNATRKGATSMNVFRTSDVTSNCEV
ncbi:hypothetical protein A7985_04140 [Pseudoalteromonas luteoviolacea]|uniref:TonB C-terminal domain-containing protein n=1 Tax=Pseudoalteromonas luteoviolacea TaxID=43657 RepID=A0A1C0TUZ9_9GAMM|nr:energy transducer TonB [Pseudoalteromonas luteoviolacea]OCQ23148.1 hypothetical protein A7985_04140 [Pseudoalteromonas luteoviolacea]